MGDLLLHSGERLSMKRSARYAEALSQGNTKMHPSRRRYIMRRRQIGKAITTQTRGSPCFDVRPQERFRFDDASGRSLVGAVSLSGPAIDPDPWMFYAVSHLRLLRSLLLATIGPAALSRGRRHLFAFMSCSTAPAFEACFSLRRHRARHIFLRQRTGLAEAKR
jgi:hypothetical protein